MSHHPLTFQPYFEDRDEKRAEIGVLMSGFRLNKTSVYYPQNSMFQAFS